MTSVGTRDTGRPLELDDSAVTGWNILLLVVRGKVLFDPSYTHLDLSIHRESVVRDIFYGPS